MSNKCKCSPHNGSESFHGKASGYHYHRCRCEDCTKAHTKQNAGYYVSSPRVIKYPHLVGIDRLVYQRAYQRLEKSRYANLARRRRALKRSNGVEYYVDIEIFDRDNWICQLCNNAIDPNFSRNDRYGATIDHIIPISKGGSDTPANVQAAHWICNVRKSDNFELAGVHENV